MINLLLGLKFDGKKYHGWQIQQNALSVQEVFQRSLKKVFGFSPEIKACSRTDSGVHANEFYVNIKLEKNKIPLSRLVLALNRFLPKDIVVFTCRKTVIDFHARYSCKSKEYVYKILNTKIRDPFLDGYTLHYWHEIDVKKLSVAAKEFIGFHDFSSFCSLDNRKKGDFRRNIIKFDIERQNEIVTIIIQANGFLYNMVRIIVGTLLQVAQNVIKPSDISKIIDARNRNKAGPTARACGLYLNKVFY
ncbi:MAG: tRNA pseudouridine(38-40) synthase TruA [Oscillospiraceae bacterium]|jgi:tRNA pseudouridine38-40 synthase|nr:tRNA pseudouridine(38-40) synthase TruA [Oscillospiraceae bacterium]